MMEWLTLLIMTLVWPGVSALILVASILASFWLAGKINPKPRRDRDEEARERAEFERIVRARWESEDGERRSARAQSRKIAVDSMDASLTAFAVSYGVLMLLATAHSLRRYEQEHPDAIPWELLFQPFYLPAAPALLVAFAAGKIYRDRFRRLPIEVQERKIREARRKELDRPESPAVPPAVERGRSFY
ncbi:hypothetical protein [Salininema proteolyticum]|uniref:DUF106 domain-containing protein n=1 Tax=Salininema proteolyticum TaxID=1607685 RepID=A0ABV8TWC0_9ACTN